MKTLTSKTRSINKDPESLLGLIYTLLEVDLEHTRHELAARNLLETIRKEGYTVPPLEVDDPDCLACLHMALRIAADQVATTLAQKGRSRVPKSMIH